MMFEFDKVDVLVIFMLYPRIHILARKINNVLSDSRLYHKGRPPYMRTDLSSVKKTVDI